MKTGLTGKGGVSPCTARNLFGIVSGRSCSPFPCKPLVQSCQLHFLYAIMHCCWHPDSGPTKTQKHSRSQAQVLLSELSQLHQREFLLFLSRYQDLMDGSGFLLLLVFFLFSFFLLLAITAKQNELLDTSLGYNNAADAGSLEKINAAQPGECDLQEQQPAGRLQTAQ